jgi:hypothetical protein
MQQKQQLTVPYGREPARWAAVLNESTGFLSSDRIGVCLSGTLGERLLESRSHPRPYVPKSYEPKGPAFLGRWSVDSAPPFDKNWRRLVFGPAKGQHRIR